MQQTLGAYIKHLRRQKNMTQTDLGGELYSKSYVSALERGTIVPSRKATLFFAQQLGQPIEVLQQFLQVDEQATQTAFPSADGVSLLVEDKGIDETASLLNGLLRGNNPDTLSSVHAFATLSDRTVTVFPFARQAHYAFLQGLLAQEQGDFAHALTSLEFALALSPTGYRPAILDALGMTHYLACQYHTALSYHVRAYHSLHEDVSQEVAADLCLLLEVHCADDYRALGLYQEALSYYERARRHLSATHNMKMAAQLYQGLGYCTYALLFQYRDGERGAQALLDVEVQERNFQQATGFLIQCRSLYQASHDLLGESIARLLQAMILLDFTFVRQRRVQEDAGKPKDLSFINIASLLEDAEQQCQQVLMTWFEVLAETDALPLEVGNILYTSLAYLTRIHVRRAASSRLSGYTDTAERERSLASSFCSQTLAACMQQALPLTLMREVIYPSKIQQGASAATLPRLPDLSKRDEASAPDCFSLSDLYFAAGELAEELGRTATRQEYVEACYTRADQCFRLALDMLPGTPMSPQRDFGYISRSYLRYIYLLEDRLVAMPDMEGTVRPLLFALLKEVLEWLPYPVVNAGGMKSEGALEKQQA